MRPSAMLPPIGGAPVALMVQGRKFDAMVLAEVLCDSERGPAYDAVLIFKQHA